MNRYFAWVLAPVRRQFWLMVLSGSFIVAAFGSSWLPGASAHRAVLMSAAALLAGSGTARQAWRSLVQRQLTIDLLVTVAAGGALLIGEYWEAAAVTFLFLFGAYLEARLLGRTRQALGRLLDLAPTVAVVWRNGQQLELPADAVPPGETVVVKQGNRIPVDGVVTGGQAVVDESMMTGEPVPVAKAIGAPVYAGTINQEGLLWLRATGAGSDTALARIIERVEEAQEQAAPLQRTIERFARWYTPAILGLSGAAFLLTHHVELALTLLVIGCPGALVIATPVAAVAGIGRAAQRGILIKGGERLEMISRITALALDKTGTLTEGKPRLIDVVAVAPAPDLACPVRDEATDGWNAAQQRVLCWAAIAEGGSEHPLARPVLAAAQTLGALPPAVTFAGYPGRGVDATYGGHAIVIGSVDFLGAIGISTSADAARHLVDLQTAGATASVVAVDRAVIGLLGVADTGRTMAAEFIRRLSATRIQRVAMLTGDDRRVAETIAKQVGITEIHAGLLPEDKVSLVRRLQQQGYIVGMVGDGVNDAPALAAADVGIAMGAAGTAVAIETADVVLVKDDLLQLPEAIRLAQATVRIVRQNIGLAVLTVGALMIGVLLGDVRMAGGMFIHEASVIVVILNGMRLLRA
jgi:Cd2+/Zn2+-exporting ATPase